jgi:hypothetical protein
MGRYDKLADSVLTAPVVAEPAATQAAGTALAVATKPVRLEPWKPFPVGCLPEPVRGFAVAASNSMGCDPSLIALPMLAALASSIGSSRSLLLKHGWFVPAILWAAIVAESGSMKSPAFRLALSFLRDRQRSEQRGFEAGSVQHKSALNQFAIEHEKWLKQGADETEEPSPPVAPVFRRLIVADATVESLAPILIENPRGVLLVRDELAGWLAAFDKYSGGKGSDESIWLSAYGGDSILVDRRTGNPRTIFVPHALVSITGGVQPAVLSRLMGKEHRESGLLARFLLCSPPRQPKVWTEAQVDDRLTESVRRLFDDLLALEPGINEAGDAVPVAVKLSPEAKALFRQFYVQHNEQQAELTGDLAAAWAKLEETPGRLALTLHCVRLVAGDSVEPLECDADTMAAAIELTQWFKHETRRVYSIMGETPAVADKRRLLDWLSVRGGTATVRQVQQGCRWLKQPGAAEAACHLLVADGDAVWRDVPPGSRGGRPTQILALRSVSTSTEPSETAGIRGLVDVDAVDALGNRDDWGAG